MTLLSDKPILIVDDNLNNLKVLAQVLKSAKLKVAMAKSGEVALQQIAANPPSLILLDILMPGIGGFAICQKLKENPETTGIPVIFMTSLNDTENKIKGLSIGAVDYITKPFQAEEVLARIKLQLKLQTLTKDLQGKNKLLEEEVKARTTAESKLQQLNQDLENRVEERTKELSQTLEKLQNTQIQLLQREDKLRYDALHDTLTNLPNRSWLVNRLQTLIELSTIRPDYLYAVLFIDLDRFKVVNDSLGHIVGDELLKLVAQRLKSLFERSNQIAQVARFGGDEFVIILEAICDHQEASIIAQKIEEQLKHPFALRGYRIFVGASIGITFSTIGYQYPEEILRDADAAMYRAKQIYQDHYAIFDPQMQDIALERLQLEIELRQALERQEFSLYYQPIVSLTKGNLVGFEALIRWNHPSRGQISPAHFIPIAEEIGLINDLGWWILREACEQCSIWQHQLAWDLPLEINVNLSALQLKQENFLEKLEKVLVQTNFQGSCLKLELTESCFLEALTWEAKQLEELKSLGVKLCIDDFGTGYSSLSRLHELPIDTLKIDRSFVNQISSNIDKKSTIVETIVSLARSLDVGIVVEGIENSLQLNKVRDLGCEVGQGYLFAKPVNSKEAAQFLNHWNPIQA